MYRSFILGLLLCLTFNALGQQQVRYMQDSPEKLDFKSASVADYSPYGLENFGLNNGTYWFKIFGSNTHNQVLTLPSPHVYDATLYNSRGLNIGQEGFTRFTTYKLSEATNYPLFLKVKLHQEAQVPMELTSEAIYDAETQKTLFQLGLYYGFAIMVVLINLMCFVLFDEKVFLKYAGFLVTVGLAYAFTDGLFNLFGITGNFINLYLEPILQLSVGLMGAAFACQFLRSSQHFPRLKWFTLTLISFAGLSFGLYWGFGEYSYATVGQIMLFAVALTYLATGIRLWNAGLYARIFVVSYSLLFLMATDFYLLKSLGLNFLNIQAVHLKIGSVFEMLVLSYAIMYRMRSIKEEKELMSTEMRIYLKRIESLSRGIALVDSEEEAYLENLIDHYDLDATETRLLQYVSEGKENHKIARILNLSEREVERLTLALYRKLEIAEQIQDDYRMLDQQPDYIYN
ncbi:7TM diverse intracellular signaling domain-containing protein [Gilvibacter sp.]|uniref:7TM diverse intracellular signaling domain-containing protein n=1 Tax=Gilvibacter sp. TaxID=2729997 RepID=UPI003F49FC4D